MKIKTNGIYILLGLSVVLALTSAFITYRNTQEKEQTMRTVIRRYKSIASSIELLSLLTDMETGQRGYIITGDSDFLEPYDLAKGKLPVAIDTLGSLVVDNEQQSNLINGKIISAIENKSVELEEVIKVVNVHGTDSAARHMDTKKGKAYMDTLRILVQNLIDRERTLLDVQNSKLEENTRIEDSFRFVAFGLIAATSLAAIVQLLQKQRNIRLLIERLELANITLEKKVADRTRELVAANQAKNHFLGIASHDLKVPIAGIQNLITLMKGQERSASDKEYFGYMEDSCQMMQSLITNLLDINRIEQGEAIVEKQFVALDRIFQNLKREFVPLAKRKDITLHIATTEIVAYTDLSALQRILENLLSNAIKFSPAGTTVNLDVNRMEDVLNVEVADQGPGIRADELHNLFGKFKKLSNKPTAGEGSSGLGLSIARELANLLDGDISVKSRPGEGTVFIMSLYHQSSTE
jgi:signal transduction histidine kinase